MKRKFIIIISIITLCNIPPFKSPFTWFDQNDYSFSNNNGSFTYDEFQYKEDDFERGMREFVYFKEKCKCSDTILYRLTKNNPLKFWRYGEYIFSVRYHLPYQDWEQIKPRRKPNYPLGTADFK